MCKAVYGVLAALPSSDVIYLNWGLFWGIVLVSVIERNCSQIRFINRKGRFAYFGDVFRPKVISAWRSLLSAQSIKKTYRNHR
jgi:hypothetical protein